MTEPALNVYSLDFFSVWETFTEELTDAFDLGGPDTPGAAAAAERPLAAEQMRYVLANLAIAKLLKSLDQKDTAAKFHFLAEAWQDTVDGIKRPIFQVERRNCGGRPYDASNIWRLRANLCVGLEFLIASGLDPATAIDFAIRKHKISLAKLQRPKTDINSSLKTWRKSFATENVQNNPALITYKDGIGLIEEIKSFKSSLEIRQMGERLIAKAANSAARLTQNPSPE